MRTFTEFYAATLGFVMFKLYSEANLKYPPLAQSESNESDEKVQQQQADIEALTLQLRKSKTGEETEDDMDLLAAETGDEQLQKAISAEKSERESRNIFSGVKAFISRECPRAPLAFCIRSLGGEVSWDKELFPGGTFEMDDDEVTHLIIDRPKAPQRLGRQAVQPQWVFDSVNFRNLLPVSDYVPGAELPPHLSPFIREGQYQPPEMAVLESKARGEDPGIGKDSDEEISESESSEDEDEAEEQPAKKAKVDGPKEGVKRDVKAASRDKKEAKEDVIAAENVKLAKSAQTNKKRKRLLERIETSERRKKGEKDKLVAKRAKIDQKKAEEKKAAKKANKKK